MDGLVAWTHGREREERGERQALSADQQSLVLSFPPFPSLMTVSALMLCSSSHFPQEISLLLHYACSTHAPDSMIGDGGQEGMRCWCVDVVVGRRNAVGVLTCEQ